MGHRPSLLRLLAALILALGLMGSIVTPSLAQDDGTPVAEEQPADNGGEVNEEPTEEAELPAEEEEQPAEEEAEQTAEGFGSLLLLYYLCDGGEGFIFSTSDPGLGNPNPLVDDCAPASAADVTDRTFYVYLFGDLTSEPIEITTVDGMVQDDALPVTDGTPHIISNMIIPPVEPTEEVVEETAEEEEEPVQATFEIAEETITGVNASQFQTGTVEIYKFLCVGDPGDSRFNPLNPGEAFDGTPYEECQVADASFTITPFSNDQEFDPIPAETDNGMVTLADIPSTSLDSGAHTIAEDGTEILGLFDVEPNTTTVIVAVNYEEAPEESGELVLTKFACVGENDTEWYLDEEPSLVSDPDNECESASEDFSIYPYGDMNAEPITFSTDENGVATIGNLPVTADASQHVIVEDSTDAEYSFDIADGEVLELFVVNYEPPVVSETGTLEMDVLSCTGIADVSLTIGDPGDDSSNIPSNCSSDSARFIIYPFSDQDANPIQIDVTQFDSVELPVTDSLSHYVMVTDAAGAPIADGFFEIGADLYTPMQLRLPTYGTLTVYSFLCEGTPNSTFDVYGPGQTPSLPADCDNLDRDFTITLYGTGASRTVSTGEDGIVGLSNVPTTNSIKHTIAKSSGVTASFDIAEGRDTVIISVSWQEDGGVVDDDGDSENVGEVSDTGIGPMAPAGPSSTLFFGLLSLATLIGGAVVARRRIA